MRLRGLALTCLRPIAWLAPNWKWYRRLVGGTWYKYLECKFVQG